MERSVLLFDGVCNLCSGFVIFTIKRDPQGKFKFSPLQSEEGKKKLKKFNLPTDKISTFILIDSNSYHLKSSAALRVFKKLTGLWPFLFIFILVPKPVRDFVYDIVAKNRYRWFGKKNDCMVPSPEIRARFL